MAFLPAPVLPARRVRPAAGCRRALTPRLPPTSPVKCATTPPSEPPKQKRTFFGGLREAVLRPLVATPGSQASGSRVVDCPFCSFGRCDCTGCGASGTDAIGEKCIMCDAKGSLVCTVCNGMGVVDRVRRGGTDIKNEWTKKRDS